ncbi:MAG: hypothetical protein HC767_13965 [Akkermansiaceae bacterium]|nr:hypothetical protein [Akkermansiaceae bacterium]
MLASRGGRLWSAEAERPNSVSAALLSKVCCSPNGLHRGWEDLIKSGSELRGICRGKTVQEESANSIHQGAWWFHTTGSNTSVQLRTLEADAERRNLLALVKEQTGNRWVKLGARIEASEVVSGTLLKRTAPCGQWRT